MPRRKIIIKRNLVKDPKYGDYEVEKFINSLMIKGKKSLARSKFYKALDILKEKMKDDGFAIFKKALENVKPKLEVRPRRVGGATYQIPQEVPSHRSTALAIRWILQSIRARKGKSLEEKLVDELMEASKNEGPSVKKKQETHKMAESNRAFAHYKW
ncbi:MAG: 30S ribosomal protein S7 [Candidatus Omnitrophica bacterium]|jgi:small subunit ribosomal protein S7|nr:30S ribosomal protein S7 [Candidatus Omnitrophota bacterium]